MVIDRAPEVQIGIFEDAIYLTRRQGRGWVTYPISPEHLAAALSKLPTSSGLLPPNTLGAGTVNGQRFYYSTFRRARPLSASQAESCHTRSRPRRSSGPAAARTIASSP